MSGRTVGVESGFWGSNRRGFERGRSAGGVLCDEKLPPLVLRVSGVL